MTKRLIDLTIFPALAVAIGMVRRGAATPSEPDANRIATSEYGSYIGSILTWFFGSRIDWDDNSDNDSETSSSSSNNNVLNEFDDRFMPTINEIIEARDRAEREGRPFPPAWSRLSKPADDETADMR